MLNNEKVTSLTKVELSVLKKRYKEHKSLLKIAEELNLTEARVAVIHTRTFFKLQHS